jgi:plasmid stabilization system protein ParE
MIAMIIGEAEDDLEFAFHYYERQRLGLGGELVDEFRRAIERILEHPNAWQPLDETYRRCRLHRFPYSVIYRTDATTSQIVIVAIMHLNLKPGFWRERE